jgi:nucleoside-diphosphate-sugar epimerase
MPLQQAKATLSGKKIFVTGGTGFVGGRLIERLSIECRASVRVLVQRLQRASRIARFPIELVHGDVTDAQAVARAARDCDIIFHCAYGNSGTADRQRAVNVQGTRNVLNAAVTNGAKRLVHLSTVLVYGMTPDADVDERAPRKYLGDVYPDSKLDAEKLVMRYGETRGLPVSVLQPAEVYGPYASVWTENVLRRLRTERLILVNGGDGLCSPVYIDDLINAMMLAAVGERARGEAFLIAAERPVSWREFYGAFENMLGISSTVSMSGREAEAYYRASEKKMASLVTEGLRLVRCEAEVRDRLLRTREAQLLKSVATRLVPASIRRSLRRAITKGGAAGRPVPSRSQSEKPVEPLDPLMIRLYETKTIFRIDKAKRLLEYEPQFSLEAGMRLTRRWAQWSNLLGQAPTPCYSSLDEVHS